MRTPEQRIYPQKQQHSGKQASKQASKEGNRFRQGPNAFCTLSISPLRIFLELDLYKVLLASRFLLLTLSVYTMSCFY